MNSKKAGLAYLVYVVCHYIVIIAIMAYYTYVPGAKEISIITNLILSEMLVLLPILLISGLTKKGESLKEILGFHKIKLSTAGMTVLFTFLVMPLATLLNAISMLFVDNVVTDMAGDIIDVPFLLGFFLIAIYGPLCEEAAFRGCIYSGFRKSGNIFGAVIWSAIIFGLMHMNFNQAPYAIALGIMMALLREATGSTTASFLCHMLFNAEGVCAMYIEMWLNKTDFLNAIEEQAGSTQDMLMLISMDFLVTIVCVAIAFCVLIWIAENEGREGFLREVLATRKIKKEPMISMGLIMGIIGSLLYMVMQVMMS